MLYFASWKRALVILTCLAGVAFAAPNLLNEQGRAEIPSWLPSDAVNLGLDLQGGAYLLVDVQIDDVYSEHIEQMGGDMRSAISFVRETENAGFMEAVESLSGSVVDALLGTSTDEFLISVEEQTLTASLTDAARLDILTRTMSQSLEIIRRRIDPEGTKEVTIQRQGERRARRPQIMR